MKPIPKYAGGGSVNPAKWISAVRRWLEPAIVAPSGPKQWRGTQAPGPLGESLGRLKRRMGSYTPKSLDELLKRPDGSYLYPKTGWVYSQDDYDELSKWLALDKYIEGPMKKYITNRMGTQDDEIRQLAGKGVVLKTQRIMPSDIRKNLENRRVVSGYPAQGVAGEVGPFHPQARNWEDVVDNLISERPAGDFAPSGPSEKLKPIPLASDKAWLSKVPPETPTYSLTEDLGNALGFDHMLDALNAEMQAGRLNPRNLNALPIEQAVRITSDYDKRLVEEARKASLAAMKGNLLQKPTKEYPNGYRWIELPDTSKEEAAALCKAIGKQGGWCTMDDISYGRHPSKLHVLIDPEGNPHAQIQTRKRNHSVDDILDRVGVGAGSPLAREILSDPGIDAAFGDPRDKTIYDQIFRWLETKGGKAKEVQLYHKEFAARPENISEIKPLNNDWGSARVRDWTEKNPNYRAEITPMLEDFIQSRGPWGEVRDLHNTNLEEANSFTREIQTALAEKFGPKQYYSQKELDAVGSEEMRHAKHFRDILEFSKGGAVRNDRLKALAFRAGGSVHEELMAPQNFAEGGFVAAYPRKRYIEKGWKPEPFDPTMLRFLGEAFARAEKRGILPPEAKSYFQTLPLIEGKSRWDYGVNEANQPHHPDKQALMEQLGIVIGDPRRGYDPAGAGVQLFDEGPKNTRFGINPMEASQDQRARLATLLFKQKLQAAGGDLDRATQLWNGSGPLSRAYLQKFKEAQGLLSHPLNAGYLNAFESGYTNAAD